MTVVSRVRLTRSWVGLRLGRPLLRHPHLARMPLAISMRSSPNPVQQIENPLSESGLKLPSFRGASSRLTIGLRCSVQSTLYSVLLSHSAGRLGTTNK